MVSIAWFIGRARAIRESQGPIGLIRRSISFALEPVFWRRTFILYQRTLQHIPASKEVDFKPDIENLSLKIISSPREAEELENDGFMFRSYPTFDNTKLKFYWKVMDVGAIATCAFVGKDLANIQFIIPTKNAMKKVTPYRTRVDFSGGETYTQSAWTNPKYRLHGLAKYNAFFNRDPFLLMNGITVVRSTFWDQNELGQKMAISLGAERYGKAKLTKFLWWRFWEGETPLDATDNHEADYDEVK